MPSMAEKIAAGRVPCCVPGCGVTAKEGPSEIICRKHWQLADRSLRHRYSALLRKAKRTGWSPRIERIFMWNWRRIRRQVIERAMGI